MTTETLTLWDTTPPPHECTPEDCACPCTDLAGIELARHLLAWTRENDEHRATAWLESAISDPSPAELADAIEYARLALLDGWHILPSESGRQCDERIATMDARELLAIERTADAADAANLAETVAAVTADPVGFIVARIIAPWRVEHVRAAATLADAIDVLRTGEGVGYHGAVGPGYCYQAETPGARLAVSLDDRLTAPRISWRTIAEHIRTDGLTLL